MKTQFLLSGAMIAVLLLASGQAAGPQSPASNAAGSSAATPRAVLDRYCVTCHNTRTNAGGLALDTLDLAGIRGRAETWERVVRKLRAGMMPPAGSRRPSPEASEDLTAYLERELDRGASPDLRAPGLHRLNRAEYANAVRDLLAVDIDASALLPVDDESYGFDNMAASLRVSPALLEAYISAAGKISRIAFGNVTQPAQGSYSVPADYTQMHHVEGLPFGTRGGLLIQHEFPSDGEYTVKILPLRGNTGALFGSVKGEQLEVIVDGERVKLFDFDKEVNKLETRMAVKAGKRAVGVTFLASNMAPSNDLNKGFLRSTIETGGIPGYYFYPHIGSVWITGPYNAKGADDTPSRRRVLVCRPSVARDEPACAKNILTKLVRGAFRRPARPDDLDAFMAFYETGRKDGGFEHGVEMALRRILTDPEFLFRTEADPPGALPGRAYRISDLELASRLSFFLWSSIPDEELLDLAAQGKLKDARVLEAQVRRMLTDRRSDALVTNFAGQWLQLRNLQSAAPLVQTFSDFDDNLRQSLRRETELFFDSIVREDRSVIDLLTADYTFVNERLARHYGIPNVYGEHFRRVTLNGDLDVRRGLLGKGSVLLVTSQPNRTSPVQRGKWILMNLLGTIPPDPPANVPKLDENVKNQNGAAAAVELSVRQRMEQHRSDPQCASCHRMMDPIGFSLENFDATGKWQARDGDKPIDASGELTDGTKTDGPASLRQALLRYSPQFVRTLTEKLLTYALGRGVESADMPVVRAIVGDAAGKENRFSSLVLGIVRSQPFQMNMKVREPGRSAQ
jgi:mono/diheme cytochrome c family protein